MAKRAAAGSGNIRQRPDGRWEARYTYTDDLGQPKRGSVYALTQKECRRKLTETLKQIDDGSYHKVKRWTLAEWLDEWQKTYCKDLKPRTVEDYRGKIERYILPNLGAVHLAALTPMQIQRFCNRLSDGYAGQRPLSPKSVKNVHGILHSALKRAVLSGMIDRNPADNTKLPKVGKPDLNPLMDDDITRFLSAIEGDPFERVFILDLFAGLRQSEILGLQWQDVDFQAGTLHVCRQLQKKPRSPEYHFIQETKNGKARTVPIPPTMVQLLRDQKRQQAEWQLAAGEAWSNQHNLVFTDPLGGHLKHHTVYKHFKRCAEQIGMGKTRFHDMRHTCAIMGLQSGCSVKAVQELMGHYSAAFTMDVYGAVSDAMRKDTQERMEGLIKQVSDL